MGDEPLDHDDQVAGDHDGEAAGELARLVELAEQAGQELAALRAEVARDHERAAARERIIDRLHDDNQRLRAGERHLLLQPLLTDLQRLRHELLRTAAALPAPYSGEQAAELLHSYAYNLELTWSAATSPSSRRSPAPRSIRRLSGPRAWSRPSTRSTTGPWPRWCSTATRTS